MWRAIKFSNSVKIAATIVLARTFGRYLYSMDGHDIPDMAVYHWRGRDWAIPTAPLDR